MYNEEIKLRYISEAEKYNDSIRSQMNARFNNTSEQELTYGKDLFDFTTNEIMDYYKCLYTPSLKTLIVLNNSYESYTNWAISQGLVKDSQNHFSELTNELLATCVNTYMADRMITTREFILEEMHKLNNVSDRFLLLAIFEGIYGKNCSNLYYAEYSHINGNIIELHDGKKIEISNELKELAKKSSETYEYYCYNPNEANDIRKYNPSDKRIIKQLDYASSLETPRLIYRRIDRKFQRMLECLEITFTKSSLLNSGRIHFINNLYDNGNYVDITECIFANKEAIEKRYGKIQCVKTYVIENRKYLR